MNLSTERTIRFVQNSDILVTILLAYVFSLPCSLRNSWLGSWAHMRAKNASRDCVALEQFDHAWKTIRQVCSLGENQVVWSILRIGDDQLMVRQLICSSNSCSEVPSFQIYSNKKTSFFYYFLFYGEKLNYLYNA